MLNATPLLKLYGQIRKPAFTTNDFAALQKKQLLTLVRHAQGTRFGKEHFYGQISSVEEYQRQVPLRTYEQFWQEYWQPSFPRITDSTWPGTLPFFAVSSGTSSGTTKYIPYPSAMQRSNTKAGIDVLAHHLRNKPSTRVLAGKSFMLGGSTELVELAPNIFSGDLSGIAVKTMPWWLRPRYFPDQKLALLKNWEEKIEILAEQSLQNNIRLISGVPSWMLIFFDKLFERIPSAERRIKNVFPNLEVIVHGGVSFAPYYKQFSQLLAGSNTELREVYPASEGFIAIADRGYGDGLRLNMDHGMFFEFVPVEELSSSQPTRHWVGNAQKDINYAIVLTTCAGLWSYVLGDTVRFVDTDTPRILITGRTSYYLSAFGEHLIAEEIDDAMQNASQLNNLTVTDYSVGAVFPEKPGDLGGHIYYVEFSESSVESGVLDSFVRNLDERLCKRNEDYEAHRANGFGLKAPEVRPLPPGTFRDWMAKRGKLGGQNKVPRIINDQELLGHLRQFVAERTTQG